VAENKRILIINALDKSFCVAIKTEAECKEIKADNLSSNLAQICGKILTINNQLVPPSEINVLSGPGSFTSTRIALITAKTFAVLWQIPIKTCTVMECVMKKYTQEECTEIVLATGTKSFFIYDVAAKKEELSEELPAHDNWTTNIPNTQCPIPFPDLTDLIYKACLKKDYNNDPQPYYSIKPAYLKTESEISDEQKKMF